MQVLSISSGKCNIIVPVNMVAQITGLLSLQMTERFSNSEVPRVMGMVKWREFEVPLLRSTSLFSEVSDPEEEYSRIVILWPMKSQSNRDFIALTSREAPKVNDMMSNSFIETPFGLRYCQGCVQLSEEVGLIPDLEQISSDLFGAVE